MLTPSEIPEGLPRGREGSKKHEDFYPSLQMRGNILALCWSVWVL